MPTTSTSNLTTSNTNSKTHTNTNNDKASTSTLPQSSAAALNERSLPGRRRRRRRGYDNSNDSDGDNDGAAAGPSLVLLQADAASKSSAESESEKASESTGARLLRLAGYRGSGGLGKYEQGAAETIQTQSQLAREGVGQLKALKRQKHDYSEWQVEIELTVDWLEQSESAVNWPLPSLNRDFLCLGVHDDSVASCPDYAPISIQKELAESKSLFQDLSSSAFYSARERANSFEGIKGEIFQNRAALKLAELDRIYSRLMTNPLIYNDNNELFEFGDICAGPGGFSEFILLIYKWRAKGYGFTLKGNTNDFQLNKFNLSSPSHSFKAYYGIDGTGDITKTNNIINYTEIIEKETKKKRLHLILTDGGFSVKGNENKQEYLSQQLILCQSIIALSTLRLNGTFICKLFDTFLPFTISLLYILRIHFKRFSIIKPNQSRPANSEKYLICTGLRQENNREVIEYLLAVNEKINLLRENQEKKSNQSDLLSDKTEKEEKNVEMAVISLIPAEIIQADQEFVDYIRRVNTVLAQRQIQALRRIKSYAEDPNLPSDDQEEIRNRSIRYWELTDSRDADRLRVRQETKRKQREWESNSARSENAEEKETESHDENVNDLSRIGYVHYDDEWGAKHFCRSGSSSFFTDSAMEMWDNIKEEFNQLLFLRPLPSSSPPPPPAEFPAFPMQNLNPNQQQYYYQQRQLAGPFPQLPSPPFPPPPPALVYNYFYSEFERNQAIEEERKCRVQYDELINHEYLIFSAPSGGILSLLLFSSTGSFVVDERNQLMPLPSQYNLTPKIIPPDTVLQVILYPDYALIIDAWSLPSNPYHLMRSYSNDLYLWRIADELKSRLKKIELFLQALRLDENPNSQLKLLTPMSFSDFLSYSSSNALTAGRGRAEDYYFVRARGRHPSLMFLWVRDRPKMSFERLIELVRQVNNNHARQQTE